MAGYFYGSWSILAGVGTTRANGMRQLYRVNQCENQVWGQTTQRIPRENERQNQTRYALALRNVVWRPSDHRAGASGWKKRPELPQHAGGSFRHRFTTHPVRFDFLPKHLRSLFQMSTFWVAEIQTCQLQARSNRRASVSGRPISGVPGGHVAVSQAWLQLRRPPSECRWVAFSAARGRVGYECVHEWHFVGKATENVQGWGVQLCSRSWGRGNKQWRQQSLLENEVLVLGNVDVSILGWPAVRPDYTPCKPPPQPIPAHPPPRQTGKQLVAGQRCFSFWGVWQKILQLSLARLNEGTGGAERPGVGRVSAKIVTPGCLSKQGGVASYHPARHPKQTSLFWPTDRQPNPAGEHLFLSRRIWPTADT